MTAPDTTAPDREIPFNINWSVKVKLTEPGLTELKRQHDEFRSLYPNAFRREWAEPKTDADGFATFQLWSLMHDLGRLCIMGPPPPFETTIKLLPEGPAPVEEALRDADGWRVRELKWGRTVGTPFIAYARTAVGTYRVQRGNVAGSGWWWWFSGNMGDEGHENEDAAKAAAQADYERRIMSAIERTDGPRDAALEQAREALRPFAAVAEWDIGTDEADGDVFRPDTRHNVAPTIKVGDIRRARAALAAIIDLPTPPATEPTHGN